MPRLLGIYQSVWRARSAWCDRVDRAYLTHASGRALQQLGEYVAQVQELQQTLDTDVVRQVLVPLDAQIKEMQKAKVAKRNFDKARLDYDTAGTKVQASSHLDTSPFFSPQTASPSCAISRTHAQLASLKKSKNANQAKVNQGEQELQQMKQAMEATGQTSAQQLVEVNGQAELELIAKCCTYIDVHRSFYERGMRLCASYNAALVDLRAHVERRQQEISIDKSRAKVRSGAGAGHSQGAAHTEHHDQGVARGDHWRARRLLWNAARHTAAEGGDARAQAADVVVRVPA